MGKRTTPSRSGRSTDPSSDKAHTTVTEAFESTDEWSGGQVERGPWFHKRLNEIQTIFKFKLLCLSAAVSIPSKGQVAVFSAAHAKEHLAGKNQGTIKSPNMRTREAIDMTSSTQPQPTQAPTPAHGGYPGTPTPPTPAAPAQTYAATVVSSSGRPVSRLEQELGANALGYLIAPLAIEEADEEMLDHFVSTINNDRLAKIWRKKSMSSGRLFIKLMTEEIRDEEMSMTGENTIQAKIDTIVRSGLSEATMHNLYYMMDVYEEWADALPTDAQVTDAKKAYIFQKWVCDLSPSIKMQMQLNLASIEAKAAAKGIEARAADPVGLVTKAANIVLTDEANEQTIKGIESGHAFFSSKFDARKRPPTTGGERGGSGTAGQTWDTPKSWSKGMRLCEMCPSGTKDGAREHMDKQCKHATPEKLAERAALLASKRTARKAEWDKVKGTGGAAKLASATGAADDADEAMMNRLFEGDAPVEVDLAALIGDGTNARSLMARASSLSTATTTTAPSVATPSNADAGGSTTGGSTAGNEASIYVVGNTGDDAEDSISAGIFVGTWSNLTSSNAIVPFINESYLENQMLLDTKALKLRTKVANGLESAVARCGRLGIIPTYMGPAELEGLTIGDNVEAYLRKGDDEHESEGESEPAACTSSDESDGGDEPAAEVTNTTTQQRNAANDAAALFDSQPPTQPPARAAKFDQDLGNVAGAAAATAAGRTSQGQPSVTLSPPSTPLSVLTQSIESVDINTHIEVIRGIIRHNALPVSPATGGSEARTKFEMINEMRDLIGSSPLPLEALLRRRGRVTPIPPAPMGIRVGESERYETRAPPPAAMQRGDATERELDFTEARPSLLRRFCVIMPLLILMQVLVGAFVQHPNISGLIACRNFAPEWTCNTLGYSAIELAPPRELPAFNTFAVEPGAPDMSQVPHGLRHGGVGFALIMPMLICAMLALHSAYTTVLFAKPRLARAARAWVARKDPLRATSSTSPRETRRRPPRYGGGSAWTSSSRFLSTLGEAPLWLSICILAFEVSTCVVPGLAALSIQTVVINTARGFLAVLCNVYGSYEMTPMRVLSRFCINVATAIIYLAVTMIVGTVTSERPFVSAGDLWRSPYAHGTYSRPRSSYLGAAATIVYLAAYSLVRTSSMDLFRWGGAASDKLSSKTPTETDPQNPDYTTSDSSPRALHAINPMRIAGKRAKQLDKNSRKRTLPSLKSKQGRALLSQKPASKVSPSTQICWSVIDSGCSWHCHPYIKDLINTRRCNDTMTGIDGKPQKVTCIGDLPALTRDHLGVWRRIVIRNVRCVPTFSDTLISVDQFWQDSQVDTIFNSTRCLAVPGKGEEPPLDIPFERRENLYKWAFIPTSGQNSAHENSRALKATIHRPNSTSFFNALPPNEALELLSRRLHVGHGSIKKLGTISQDVPPNISKGQAADCEHYKTANAIRVPHPGKAYKPSHVGRLIHGDIAGPFKRSQHGFLYFLVLVDDHSRFKQVYFLKKKSEALARIKTFVAKLNSICNVGKPEAERVRIVGQLHLDNAGEFLSREFTEYLESESIARTTCPPHVHQLNGVAERAIRSVMEIVRATREASACPVGFWPHLVEHAVDVLNRVTGPPCESGHEMSAYEAVTGQKPKILNIMPIGCRAYAVKPPNAYTKSGFEARAWAGICLGRSSTIPSAYNIWLPTQQKLIQTSEVYFDESLYPWRPAGDQRVGLPTPSAAPPTDEHDITAGGTSTITEDPAPKVDTASSLPESFASATRAAQGRANTSITILLLFSGAYRRPDGIAQFARKLGLKVEMYDNDTKNGGGADADLTNDDVYDALRERIMRGEFAVILAAPPCSTFSISRFFESLSSSDGGPPVVRTRAHIEGSRFVPTKHRAELDRANDIVARMAALLLLAHRAGTQFVIENPSDRGDLTKPKSFLHAEHGPLWLMPAILALGNQTSTKLVTFAMCAFGAEWQKETTLMYTAGLDAWFDSLDEQVCTHGKHSKVAGGDKTGDGWNSSATAAYPSDFNNFVAQAFASFVRQRQSSVLDDVDPNARKTIKPRPNASLESSTSASAEPTSTAIPVGETAIDSSSAAATDATSTRKLDFSDHSLGDIHEEPDTEELPDTLDQPADVVAPAKKQSKPKVTFEKTAGARSTRSNNPTVIRGLGTSTGFAMLSIGMTLSAAVFAMGTVDLLDELSKPAGSLSSTLSAALAKPSTIDPKSQSEAYNMDKPGWMASEAKELKNHDANGSWEYIDACELPRGRRLVKLVWVYKVKRDGSLKSRLCVQGCRQVPGVDYDQTWCGAMRGTSLRVLSNLAANSGMKMRRYDFVAAYLQGELLEGETVYCYPPPGYEHKGKDGRNQICRVLKPVYGMAQAGRRWQRTLFPWLLEFGFVQTHSDQSVFTLERTMQTPDGERRERIHVGVYVDDLAVVYSHDDKHSLYRSFISALEKRWNVEDEGELTDLLGIEFTRGDKFIELKQTKYIEKLASEHFPNGVPPTAQQNKVPCDRDLPALVNLALLADVAPDSELLRSYQSICGALLYASTNTRPDIAFATGMLCRAMGRPNPELLESARRVLGYLYRTRHIGLRYEASPAQLEGFSDSDWGVKHSTSGHTFHLGSATISWASKKQPSVALSSCEAEIMAGSEAAKEAIYLSAFLRELGFDMSEPPPLRMDNKSAIDLAYNPEHHARTKHIDRRHYFIRECVEQGRLRVPFVPTAENVADFFTKPLMGKDFFRMRDRVMNVPQSSSSSSPPSQP